MDNLFNRVAHRRRRGQRGFTLVELLVVIAVLAVLAAIVIFNVAGVGNKGNLAACKTDLKSVQTAVDAYYNDNNSTYPWAGNADDWTKLVPTYIHNTPTTVGTVTIDGNGTVTSSIANCTV